MLSGGRVLAAYDTKNRHRPRRGQRTARLYTHPTSWDVYGVIALDDLLAGSTDFTPLNFAE